MDISKYLDPAKPLRRWITFGLVVAGAAAGMAIGVVVTVVGKAVTGAPPADFANYMWNAVAFGIMGAVFAPAVTWLTLRHVPLWRAVLEPVTASIIGAGLAAFLGSGVALLALPPAGAAAAVIRLGKTKASRHR